MLIAQSPRIVPGAAVRDLVIPQSSRVVSTHSKPSRQIAITGVCCMKRFVPPKKSEQKTWNVCGKIADRLDRRVLAAHHRDRSSVAKRIPTLKYLESSFSIALCYRSPRATRQEQG